MHTIMLLLCPNICISKREPCVYSAARHTFDPADNDHANTLWERGATLTPQRCVEKAVPRHSMRWWMQVDEMAWTVYPHLHGDHEAASGTAGREQNNRDDVRDPSAPKNKGCAATCRRCMLYMRCGRIS